MLTAMGKIRSFMPATEVFLVTNLVAVLNYLLFVENALQAKCSLILPALIN
jgi:hypothetical protein